LDLSIVKPGVTTGFDVNGLLIQGGGKICAGLDVAGAAFEVKRCGTAQFNELEGANIFPNPATDALNLQLNSRVGTGPLSVDIMDLNGKMIQRQVVEEGVTQTELNISNLSSGMYFVRINGEGRAAEMLKFTKQ
jgi:hypothetical protein